MTIVCHYPPVWFVCTVNVLRLNTPMKTGPGHLIAGYHNPGLSSNPPAELFGDYETACGLRIPRRRAHMSSEFEFLPTESMCGDCFPQREHT